MAQTTRLFLIEEFCRKERSVRDLEKRVASDSSTVSRCLSLLRQAGIVEAEKRRKQVLYRLRMSCSLGVASCASASLEQTSRRRLESVAGRACSARRRTIRMSTVRMIPEEEAAGRVRDVYDEIKARLGIDFVPNLYRVMAQKPEYLEANWNKVKAVMANEGKLGRLTKEVIAVSVSAVLGCRY
jgi:DNA-binding transcriptional ArsR family regulator